MLLTYKDMNYQESSLDVGFPSLPISVDNISIEAINSIFAFHKPWYIQQTYLWVFL